MGGTELDAVRLPSPATSPPIRPDEIKHGADHVHFETVVVGTLLRVAGGGPVGRPWVRADEYLDTVVARDRTVALGDACRNVPIMTAETNIEILVVPEQANLRLLFLAAGPPIEMESIDARSCPPRRVVEFTVDHGSSPRPADFIPGKIGSRPDTLQHHQRACDDEGLEKVHGFHDTPSGRPPPSGAAIQSRFAPVPGFLVGKRIRPVGESRRPQGSPGV